jgi:outer membrane protein assembly factor BamD (BamD/ComL family)
MENFCSSSPDGRKDALRDLEEAVRLYGDLASESKETPVLAQEALMGVGKAKEALNELEAALSAYQDVVKRFPNSVSGKEAAERVKKLTENKDQVSTFYKDLDKLAAPVAPPPKKE